MGITADYVRENLNYNEETGEFSWAKGGRGRLLNKHPGSVDANGYRRITICGRRYKAHRLAWFYVNGEWPDGEIDHINHSKLDNRLCNLRQVSHQDNHKNVGLHKNNTSGITGVHFNTGVKKWSAKITVGGKQKHLGYFHAIGDAIASRKKAEEQYGFHENHGTDAQPTK